MSLSVLIVDDDTSLLKAMARYFAGRGWETFTAGDALAGVRAYEAQRPGVVILDVNMPGVSGLDALRLLLGADPDATVIMLTGAGSIEMSVEAMHGGAETFLTKPPDLTQLELTARRANEKSLLRRQTRFLMRQGLGEISSDSLGSSPMMQQIARQLSMLAAGAGPVLLTGETGTGKGWAARLIHEESPRAARPFVTVNCAGLTATFLDTELFGHERGAFTDARVAKQGLFEVADGGTLFLDEVGDLAPELQPKLLTVIETNRFRRLGATRETQVDVRLIVATHKDLLAESRAGRFREDLYYRLAVLPVELPPLRVRPGSDLTELAARMLAELRRRRPNGPSSISSEAAEALRAYSWPGNIRELRNILERADLVAGAATELRAEHLPAELFTMAARSPSAGETVMNMEAMKRQHVERVLAHCGGNRRQAALALGISRGTLYEWMERWGLDKE